MNARIVMVAAFVAVLCGTAAAQSSGGDVSPENLAGALSGLLATGAWGGLWKGALAGLGRGLLGFFGQHKGTKFEGQYMVSAALAGAVAGLVMGLLGVPFNQASGWLATLGATEVLNKTVKGLWRRWAGDHVGEAVARTVARTINPTAEGLPD